MRLVGRIGAFAALVPCLGSGTLEAIGQTARESVTSDGSEATGDSAYPATSGDGRFVTFMSTAKDLVANDQNRSLDVFLRDRLDGSIRRASVSSSGTEANNRSSVSAVTPDGRFVAFQSEGSDLVAGDDNRTWDVFRHDNSTGETIRASASSPGKGGGVNPAISADGRFVAFQSSAPDFVDDDTNDVSDVFVHDCVTGETRRVSVDTDGSEGNNDSMTPSITADGTQIAFFSEATNFAGGFAHYGVYVHDVASGVTELVSLTEKGLKPNGDSQWPTISADGRFVAFESRSTDLVSGDANGEADVFVRDRVAGTTVLASRTPAGGSGNGISRTAALARHGTAVAFESLATDLVDGDTNGVSDIFVYDLLSGLVERASVRSDGTEAHGPSIEAAIADDGGVVFFSSAAPDLVDDDVNGVSDVFSRQRSVQRAAWSTYGDGWPGTLGIPSIELDGSPIVGTCRTLLLGSSSIVDEFGVVLIGFASASIPTPLGGTLLLDGSIFLALDVPPTGTSWGFEIPFDAAMLGFPAYLQWVHTDLGASNDVSFSAGLELIPGS